MTDILDNNEIDIPDFNNKDKWMLDFRKNADALFEKEKAWVAPGKKNLSIVVKDMLLYLNKRATARGDAMLSPS